MSDVRALLKAKTKERQSTSAQIQHPLAAYNATGQLRCSLCGTTIKFNSPATWKTHLESKAHRTLEQKANAKGKRKADDDAEGMDVDSDGGGTKRRKVTPAPEGAAGFPSDFFADPNRILEASGGGNDVDDSSGIKLGTEAIDSEFEAFERAIAAASAKKQAGGPSAEVFSRATIIAEPELVQDLGEDGFPEEVAGANAKSTEAPHEEPVEEETEGQKAKRKQREEKELIMDRLLDEERAQEEADDKVKTLKTRLEAIKKQRELKKLAAKAGPKS